MRLELVCGSFAHELHGVAAFDQANAFADQPFELDRFDLGAILLALAALLGIFVVVELALDPELRTVEEVAERPSQVFEIGLDPRVDHGGNEGIEHVGDGARSERRRNSS